MNCKHLILFICIGFLSFSLISGQDSPDSPSVPGRTEHTDAGSGSSSTGAGTIALVLGIILLVAGWKLYKIFISITGLLLGLYIAHFLGKYIDISPTVQLIFISAAGILGLFLAFPFQKSIVFFLGGLGGSLLLGNPVALMFQNHENKYMIILAGMIAGFLLFGLLSLYFFKLVIIVSTSLLGSFSMVIGTHYLFLNKGVTGEPLRWSDPEDKGFALFLIIALIGVLIQHGINKIWADPVKEPEKKSAAPPKETPDPE